MSNGPMKQLVTHLHLSHIESALDVSGCFSLNTSWPKHQGQVFQRQMCLSDVSSGMNIKTPAKKCQPPAKKVKLPQIPKSHTIKISRTHLITSLTANRMTNAWSLEIRCNSCNSWNSELYSKARNARNFSEKDDPGPVNVKLVGLRCCRANRSTQYGIPMVEKLLIGGHIPY